MLHADFPGTLCETLGAGFDSVAPPASVRPGPAPLWGSERMHGALDFARVELAVPPLCTEVTGTLLADSSCRSYRSLQYLGEIIVHTRHAEVRLTLEWSA